MSSHPQQQVLIVDDDEMWRMLARVALERAGFRCIECGSVDAALDVLARQSFHCIVTDLRMPGRDGFDLCRSVRAQACTAAVPIILMTGSTDESEHRRAIEAGADTTLRKDAEFKQVVSTVRFARRG